jgi:hypothetical protein
MIKDDLMGGLIRWNNFPKKHWMADIQSGAFIAVLWKITVVSCHIWQLENLKFDLKGACTICNTTTENL